MLSFTIWAFLENVVFAESPPEELNKIASVLPEIIPQQIENSR